MFSDMKKDDIITIPDPIYMKRPKNYSCRDRPSPVLQIRYDGLPTTLRSNSALITLTNKTEFTIPSCDYATLNFNVLVTTSLPAVTIVYDNDYLLFRHGLTCVINQIPTNDTMLYIKIYNHKSIPSSFEKESLQFTCYTLLAKHP